MWSASWQPIEQKLLEVESGGTVRRGITQLVPPHILALARLDQFVRLSMQRRMLQGSTVVKPAGGHAWFFSTTVTFLDLRRCDSDFWQLVTAAGESSGRQEHHTQDHRCGQRLHINLSVQQNVSVGEKLHYFVRTALNGAFIPRLDSELGRRRKAPESGDRRGLEFWAVSLAGDGPPGGNLSVSLLSASSHRWHIPRRSEDRRAGRPGSSRSLSRFAHGIRKRCALQARWRRWRLRRCRAR